MGVEISQATNKKIELKVDGGGETSQELRMGSSWEDGT